MSRITYVRIRNGYRFFVIADLSPDGEDDFADQELGEILWRSFHPSLPEREFAHQLLREGRGQGWSAVYVDNQ
jgi:hypothetical protein